mmetsp:Transcript_28743/g.73146  ORF Transcript_28743/g.73146 Transcript_28743/m.73146 type:complete len:140 (-) Transcript_28743:532-951(-)
MQQATQEQLLSEVARACNSVGASGPVVAPVACWLSPARPVPDPVMPPVTPPTSIKWRLSKDTVVSLLTGATPELTSPSLICYGHKWMTKLSRTPAPDMATARMTLSATPALTVHGTSGPATPAGPPGISGTLVSWTVMA